MKNQDNGMCTPLGCNSVKTVLFCTVAGFIFIFAYNFVVHGHFLASTYALTPNLWRTPAEYSEHMLFTVVMYAILAYAAADIYARFSTEGSIGEGARFGLLLGLVHAALQSLPYGWLPISGTLASYWFVVGLFQGLGLGIVFSLVNRK